MKPIIVRYMNVDFYVMYIDTFAPFKLLADDLALFIIYSLIGVGSIGLIVDLSAILLFDFACL